MKLVATGHLNMEERHLLGGYVTRKEVREAVLRGFAEHGHFPPLARPWQKGEGCFEGWQLVALPKGARLLNQRAHPIAPWVLADSTHQDFETAEEAVDRYIGLEIGPTYDGVPVR